MLLRLCVDEWILEFTRPLISAYSNQGQSTTQVCRWESFHICSEGINEGGSGARE